jgi:transposase InsO family protein
MIDKQRIQALLDIGWSYHKIERETFVYLAVIQDAYSRKVISHAFSRILETVLAMEVLRMAIFRRQPAPGVIHHSHH